MTPEEVADRHVRLARGYLPGQYVVEVLLPAEGRSGAGWVTLYGGPQPAARANADCLRLSYAAAIREALEADAAPTLTVEREREAS